MVPIYQGIIQEEYPKFEFIPVSEPKSFRKVPEIHNRAYRNSFSQKSRSHLSIKKDFNQIYYCLGIIYISKKEMAKG